MKKILALLFLFFLLARPVSAEVTCTTQYGGGQTCTTTSNLLVNKKILNPVSKQYVDNLGQNDHLFAAGEEVTFAVSIKNVGDTVLNNVVFTDTLPAFLEWVGGDQLTSTINALKPGEAVTKTIKAKVVAAFPAAKNVVCLKNVAKAVAGAMSDQDSSQLCISVSLPKVVPKAGAEGLLFLPLLSGIGFYLTRFNLKGVKS
jgi:uncharacterized repeat protein (TIGR01451 family)